MDVMIVEDDAALASVWHDALADAGHEVTMAGSTTLAMRQLLTKSFDLVVLDLLVGDNNTVSLSHYLGYASPDARVMVITGSGFFPNGEVTAVAPNVDWLLRKPLRVSDFMAIVDHVADLKSARTATRECKQSQIQVRQ